MATTDRATDARVAELVMGWRPVYVSPDGPLSPRVYEGPLDRLDFWETGGERKPCGWSPTTDPAADLSVLERVRTTWDHERRWAFARALVEVVWRERGETRLPPAMRYEVGDYSRAALAVIDGRTW